MSKPEFQKIEQYIVAAFLAYIIGHYLKMIDTIDGAFTYFGISIDRSVVFVTGFTILFLISLRIVQFMWNFFPDNYQKLRKWTLYPNKKNLHIFHLFFYDNLQSIIFISTEWRYPFKKAECFATIEPFDRVHILSHFAEPFEWKKEKTTRPISIKRFLPYSINFLLVNSEDNYFQIITKENKKHKFYPRKYGFEIRLVENIYGNKVGEDEHFNKLNPIHHIEEIRYLLVNYEGGKKIKIKDINKNEYEKYYWRKQLTDEYLR